jgi:hypothetical protein
VLLALVFAVCHVGAAAAYVGLRSLSPLTVGLAAFAPCAAGLGVAAASAAFRLFGWGGQTPAALWALAFSAFVVGVTLVWTPGGPAVLTVPGGVRADLVWLDPRAIGGSWVVSAVAGRLLERAMDRPKP